MVPRTKLSKSLLGAVVNQKEMLLERIFQNMEQTMYVHSGSF